jgi:ankyrin repeat protein
VNLGSEGNSPALDSAVEWRREDIVRLLLERGADPNAIPSLPGSALESAACRSLAIVELLVDSGGPIVDGVDGRYGHHCILRCCLGRRRSCASCWIGERILMRTANSTSPWL